MEKIVVGIAEGKTAEGDQVLVSYALGSCVGICLFDKEKKLAGMAHIILPEKKYAVDHKNVYKFADEGTRELILEMERLGAKRKRIKAKIAGGAKMFGARDSKWEIGEENVKSVKQALARESIEIIAEDTGKNYGRTLMLYTKSGTLEVRTMRSEKIVL